MPRTQDGGRSGHRLRHLALGSELAGGVLIPVLLGLWADSRLDSSPICILIGTFVGLAAVAGTLLRVVKNKTNE